MAYTLEQLAGDIRRALTERPGTPGRQATVALVEKALADREFVASVFGPERTAPREVLYEDPDLGFAICAHVLGARADSHPHDHGPSWAIYGQAEGETEMIDWRVVRPARGAEPALVEPERNYAMTPGMAHLYEVGAVHSPRRGGPTKLLRVEGRNLDTVKRTPIQAAPASAA